MERHGKILMEFSKVIMLVCDVLIYVGHQTFMPVSNNHNFANIIKVVVSLILFYIPRSIRNVNFVFPRLDVSHLKLQ